MDDKQLKESNDKREETDMVGSVARVNNEILKSFIKQNKEKIVSLVPKNPSIPMDDEWRDETFWDEEATEK